MNRLGWLCCDTWLTALFMTQEEVKTLTTKIKTMEIQLNAHLKRVKATQSRIKKRQDRRKQKKRKRVKKLLNGEVRSARCTRAT